ncbi:MAG: hypothetical protein COA88_02950 [Kordia sp.]|nr:MAG: hypothetical protein COA88_02950 [Kordia sp.]
METYDYVLNDKGQVKTEDVYFELYIDDEFIKRTYFESKHTYDEAGELIRTEEYLLSAPEPYMRKSIDYLSNLTQTTYIKQTDTIGLILEEKDSLGNITRKATDYHPKRKIEYNTYDSDSRLIAKEVSDLEGNIINSFKYSYKKELAKLIRANKNLDNETLSYTIEQYYPNGDLLAKVNKTRDGFTVDSTYYKNNLKKRQITKTRKGKLMIIDSFNYKNNRLHKYKGTRY